MYHAIILSKYEISMKSSFPLLLLGAMLLSASACRNTAVKEVGDSLRTMSEQDALILPLDSVTTQITQYMQLVNDSTLAFLNKPTSEICIYSLTEPGCRNKVRIYQEGPDAVNDVDAFYVQTPDSIWLYASWDQRIFLIDGEGSLMESHTVPITDHSTLTRHTVSPYPQTTAPYIVRGDLHYLQGMDGIVSGGLLPGATLVYNTKTGEIKSGSPYPSIYGQAEDIQNRWSTFGERASFSQVSPDNNVMTSFPVSDSIYVWNPELDILSSYEASYSGRPEITSSVGDTREESFEKYIRGFQYGPIFHDPYNKLYYRLFRTEGKIDATNLRASVTRKPLGVVILDEEFEKVGETMLPEGRYYPAHAFVNSRGLHIKSFSEDDDYMVFTVFRPSKGHRP